MAETRNTAAQQDGRERYTIGYAGAILQAMQQRTLAVCSPFFLPHLRQGMTVFDCGCGAGSLTIELAEHVAPGEVVGMDVEPRALEQGRELAASRGVDNVRFEQGDAYALPYADASFDAVFSHALIAHLGEPAKALAEMRRVLKRGGVAAVIENDPGTFVVSPTGSPMERFIDVFVRVQRHNGGGRLAARHLRSALLEAGFSAAEAYAAGEGWGAPERARSVAAAFAAQAHAAEFVRTAVDQGWATQVEMAGLPEGLLAWGERPDAFFAVLKCGALGWVSS